MTSIKGYVLWASLLLPNLVNAEMVSTKAENIESVKTVKISYFGDVNEEKMANLMFAIDEVNIKYPNASNIYLYISSFGGDMDTGYLAYEAIKSSKIPVTTINGSMTGSAATMLFCAGHTRLTMPGAYFLLHPAATGNKSSEYLKPDVIRMMQNETNAYNNKFKMVYEKCTDFSEKEIDSFLSSETSRLYIDSKMAISKKLASDFASNVIGAQVSYYITN